MTENELATTALAIAFNLHRRYGPELFESVFKETVCYEWKKNGIAFLRQHPISLVHESSKLAAGIWAGVILGTKVTIE